MVIILAPTRELAQQIYSEVKRFLRNYSRLRAGLCFGGGNMYDQGKDLKKGCEILVATPGNYHVFLQRNRLRILLIGIFKGD